MKPILKSSLVAAAICCLSASSWGVTKDDIEYATVIGFERIGNLRACETFDAGKNFGLVGMQAEVALLKFLRLSNMVKNNFPEIQAGKIWLMTNVAREGLLAKQRVESLEAVIAECQIKKLDAQNFIKRLEDITAGKVR